MRVLLMCVGSRGDAEPFCALADKLLDEGHEVDFFIQPELQPYVPKGVTIHSFPFTQFDFYKFMANPTHGKDHENPRVRFVGIVTDMIAGLVFPCTKDIAEVAKNADVLVTSSLSRSVAFLLSEKYKLPCCLVNLQPLTPTKLFPHYSQQDQCVETMTRLVKEEGGSDEVGSDEFRQGYVELEEYFYEFLEERIAKVYEEMGVDPIPSDALIQRLLGNHPSTAVLNAFNPLLIPSPTDVGSHVYEIGALADAYIPKTFETPDDGLIEFLKDRPICIGYGSMPYDKVTVVLEALETLNQKAVLVGDALKPGDDCNTEWVQANVRQVSSIPYAWLLPQCKMMLSHGGAGVVAATLRAGIPALISPLLGDQFFFADYLEAIGLGTRVAANLNAGSKEDLIKAIQKAEDCLENAKSFGEKSRAKKELGVDRAFKVLQIVSESGSFPESLP